MALFFFQCFIFHIDIRVKLAHNVVSFAAFLNINEIEPSKLSSVWRAADHYPTNKENLAKIFLFTFLDFD